VRSGRLIAFRDVLRKAARSLGIEPAVYLVEARAVWPEIVGPTLAAATEIRTLRAGTLTVVAVHPLAAQEVRLRREAILGKLTAHLPQVSLRQ